MKTFKQFLTEAIEMSWGEYAAKNDIPLPLDDHGAFGAGGKKPKTHFRRILKKQMADSEIRNRGWEKYNLLLKQGKIKEPSRLTKLKQKARGHDDNLSVKAARRVLTKQGITWE